MTNTVEFGQKIEIYFCVPIIFGSEGPNYLGVGLQWMCIDGPAQGVKFRNSRINGFRFMGMKNFVVQGAHPL